MADWRTALRSTVGRKVLMAVSGAGVLGWLVLHILGNLQVFRGAEVINGYGRALHDAPLLLWGQRVGLGILLAVHAVTAAGLEGRRRRARPHGYAVVHRSVESWAARGMRYTGPLVLALLAYHLMHFTLGNAHPDFRPADVHHNLVRAFAHPGVVALYVAFMLLVGWHLVHGGRSLWYSLGWMPLRHAQTISRAVLGLVIALVASGVAIPVVLLAQR